LSILYSVQYVLHRGQYIRYIIIILLQSYIKTLVYYCYYCYFFIFFLIIFFFFFISIPVPDASPRRFLIDGVCRFEGFTSDSMTTTRYQSTVIGLSAVDRNIISYAYKYIYMYTVQRAFVFGHKTVRPPVCTDLTTSPRRTVDDRRRSRG
jgi:hypothetical protein